MILTAETWPDLVFTGNSAATLSHDCLLLVEAEFLVDPLVLIQLVHSLTERDGLGTPGVPGRSTAHSPRLAGLHTLQEVVVLLLLAGLLRPVEEVVLGHGDLVEIKVSRLQVLPCFVLKKNPGENGVAGENVVELGVVQENSVQTYPGFVLYNRFSPILMP